MDAKLKTKPSSKVIRPDEITSLLQEGEFGAILDYTVTDKNGRIVSQVSKKAESYVQQFLQILYAAMTFCQDFQIRDCLNIIRSFAHDSNIFNTNASSGDTTYGIIVGSGVTPVTISDYAINTLIANGVGAGQLQYSGHTYGSPAANTTTSQLTITRNFANNSGSSITVNEIALYCRDGNNHYFMIIRDVISGGIDVPNGQTLTVNYRPQATI